MENFVLMKVWNDTIEKGEQKLEKRERVYASELGWSMIDRFLKMNATPYTNPPNSRSYRKFMAWDIWEWIVQVVLVKAGINFRTQEKVTLEYEWLLPISWRIDFIITGETDWEAAEERLKTEEMPEFMRKLATAILENYKGKVFKEKILEIKSVGSFVFDNIESVDNPKTYHMNQGGAYALSTGIDTDIIYVSRDDVRILQYSISGIIDEIEKDIIDDLTKITYYIKNNVQPEKEKMVVWNNDKGKFEKNWKVEYSPYLSMLYSYITDDGEEKPFDQPDEFYDWASKKASAWNRVVTRIKEAKDLTKSNMEYIEEMNKEWFDVYNLIAWVE